MPLPQFQNEVENFVNENNLEIPVRDRMLDLNSEVGELAKEILLSTDYGNQEFSPSQAWAEELGDVFFSLICLANTTDVNLLKSMRNALAKYRARLNIQGEAGSRKSQTS